MPSPIRPSQFYSRDRVLKPLSSSDHAIVTGAFRARWDTPTRPCEIFKPKMILDKRIKEIAKLNFVKGEPFLNQVSAAWEVEYRQRWVRFNLIAKPPPSCLIPLRLPPHLGVSTEGGCLFNRFVYGLHILRGVCMRWVS